MCTIGLSFTTLKGRSEILWLITRVKPFVTLRLFSIQKLEINFCVLKLADRADAGASGGIFKFFFFTRGATESKGEGSGGREEGRERGRRDR